MKILFVGSIDRALVGFRGPLIEALLARGHEVTAAAPRPSREVIGAIQSMGASVASFSLERAGRNPLADLNTRAALHRLVVREAPDAVLAFGVKPIAYTLPIAQRLRVGTRVALVEGLGRPFAQRAGLTGWMARRALQRGLQHASRTLVLNEPDRDDLVNRGFVPANLVTVLPGTGVDLRAYPARPLPEGPPVFLMIGRRLRAKGLEAFAHAASVVKATHGDARFILIVEEDRGDVVPWSTIHGWASSGLFEVHEGPIDVRPFLEACHVFVLPTTYLEGMPRTILEAMATGRAVVTTGVRGCRDAVHDGVTGVLTAPGDEQALALALQRLTEDRARVVAMGQAGLTRVREHFDVRRVNEAFLEALGAG